MQLIFQLQQQLSIISREVIQLIVFFCIHFEKLKGKPTSHSVMLPSSLDEFKALKTNEIN
jgi:hypothetical protein